MADKIRWGIISTANIARNALIPGIQTSNNGVVYAVASRDLARAQAFAAEHGIERAYGSYAEMLADPNVDAVYNPLPNDGHAPWSIAAAKAGKPTLCEKPLARDEAEARTIVEAFRAENVLLAEAFMYRYHPQHQKARELLGTLGKISLMTATFTYSMSFDDQVNVRLKPELGGGGLLDVGCYCVNAIRWMANEEPDSVSGYAMIGKESGVDEAFVGTLHFPSGLLAHFDCGMRGIFRQHYSVIGSAASLTVLNAFRPAEDVETQIEIRHEDGGYRLNKNVAELITIPAANQYRLMVEDFGEAVRAGRKMTYDPADSLKNMRVLEALLRASREGVVVSL